MDAESVWCPHNRAVGGSKFLAPMSSQSNANHEYKQVVYATTNKWPPRRFERRQEETCVLVSKNITKKVFQPKHSKEHVFGKR